MAHVNSWCGAPTQTGFGVVAKITGATTATLHVATNPALTGAATFAMSSPYADVWRGEASGLTAGTQYYWGVSQDGGAATQVGSARTAPSGAASFKFWTSSCAATGSDHAVFGAILGHDPDFGIHMGDLHYRDNAGSMFQVHFGYDAALNSPGQGALYRNVPTVYLYDDHDFTGNDDGYDPTLPDWSNAINGYRQRVPHFPLTDPEGIWQTFAYGRVRFVNLDTRTLRGKDPDPDYFLSAAQNQWLRSTLSAATEPVLVLNTMTPWIGNGWVGSWNTHTNERLDISAWLVANGWKGRTLIVAGDAHSISYDDGSHNPHGGLYAPVFQTAALDQYGSVKGGTYTRPPVQDRGQFGLWEVIDTGGPTIEVRMSAYSQATTLLYTETVTLPATATPSRRRVAGVL